MTMDERWCASIDALQERLGYRWRDPALLVEALTHSSWGKPNGLPYNERLEFLGDGVLDLSCAEWLMTQYQAADEGFMSGARARLVQRESLAILARELDIAHCLIVDGRHRYLTDLDSVLANAFEALVGSVYMDSGSDLRVTQAMLLRCGFFL